MDVRSWGLPFRIGTTSYIVEADLLPNALFLAKHVQDMQLVLFEVPDGPTNLPSAETVAALAELGRKQDLTYSVHLLRDLCLHGTDTESADALAKAKQVIDLTQPLNPLAWVCHLDGRRVRHTGAGAQLLAEWQAETAQALRQVCDWAGDARRVAVENLEGYEPEFVTPVVARTMAGRCVDVGHLWLDGVDPLPHLAAALSRTRVVHLHGVQQVETAASSAEPNNAPQRRDHVSLTHVEAQALDAVLRLLWGVRFDGVLCLEVFGEQDFWSSLQAIEAAWRRLQPEMDKPR
jgi:sugar phosphate isomerase/epimerase